jgi:hypothetical protein
MFEVGVGRKVAKEGDLWVTVDPQLGHANGEPMMLVTLMESYPPTRLKERDSEAEKLCV